MLAGVVKVKLGRNSSSFINLILDTLCPPFLRDCYPIMYALYYLAYGKEVGKLLRFKENLHTLSDEDIVEYYNLASSIPFNNRPTDLNDESLEYILNNIQGDTVLDAGCGRGFLCETISNKLNVKVTGLDFVMPKEIKNYSFVSGTITEMPFEDGSFDTVVCSHTLEHIRDFDLALNELVRVAKKRIIIVLPKQREYRYIADLHINFFPYLYNLQNKINFPNTEYIKLGRDWGCIINK